MALARDDHPLACFFPARFLLLLARSFPDHNQNALGVVGGDKEIEKRNEADIGYGLLGTRGRNFGSSSALVGGDSTP